MLLDQYGQTYAPRFLQAAGEDPRKRPRMPYIVEGIKRSVTQWEFRNILSISRQLYGNMGIVAGAIKQKAQYATEQGWDPVFMGEDQAWGEEVSRWLTDEWYKVCDVRGPNYSFKQSLFLDSISIDRDGDFGTLLTESVSGYPMIQSVPAHLVWNPNAQPCIVADGPFKGAYISHGVIFNTQWRPIGFRVLTEVPPELGNLLDFTKFKDVPAPGMIHVYDPEWYDQARGLPAFSFCLNQFRDTKTSHDWEMLAQLLASRVALVETNEGGVPDFSDPMVRLAFENGTLPNNGADDPDGDDSSEREHVTEHVLQGGEMRYLKAGKGEKLESLVTARPSDMWDKFQDRVIRDSLAGVNWPFSLAWKNEGLGGAPQRADIDQARSSVVKRQNILRRARSRILGYAVSKAINLKIIPPYTGKDKGGFLKWDFTMPPEISVDDGKDAQAEREGYRIGHMNLTDVLNKRGKRLEAHLRQRALEVALRKTIAEEVGNKYGVEIADSDMALLTPNGNPAENTSNEEDAAAQDGTTTKPVKKKESK